MTSPFIGAPAGVTAIMLRVLAALLPAIVVHAWFFGPGVLVNLALATAAAAASETAVLRLRGAPVRPALADLSAVVTAWLIALSLPAAGPWWLAVVGTAFAVVVAKHLYGGLGNNLFNPAMVGYAVLIVSFPAAMTRWPAPEELAAAQMGAQELLQFILTGALPPGATMDAVTGATPLDALKTALRAQQSAAQALGGPPFGGEALVAAWALSAAYLAGGLYMLQQRIITWHVPVAFLATLAALGGLAGLVEPARHAGALFHLTHGAAMIGAFFILTDPVSGSTTLRGKLLFASLAALITWVIRTWGSYPDGVAFATLIMNMCVPLIDMHTRPRVFGAGRRDP